MPPQITNGASDTGSVAGKLRLELFFVTWLINRAWRGFTAVWPRDGSGVRLQDLRDRDLRDIGVTRDEIEQFSPGRAVDRIRTRAADLWSRSGM